MQFKVLIVILIVALCVGCHRKDGLESPGAQVPVQTILLTRGQKSTHRPRTPDRQNIEVVYQGTELTVRFEIPDGICSLTLTEVSSGYSQSFIIDSGAPVATIDVMLKGEVLVKIVTASGKIYEGVLKIENINS